MSTSAGRVVVYGGKGALGSKCVSNFKANNMVSATYQAIKHLEVFFLFFQWVASIDLAENPEADLNIVLGKDDTQAQQVSTK